MSCPPALPLLLRLLVGPGAQPGLSRSLLGTSGSLLHKLAKLERAPAPGMMQFVRRTQRLENHKSILWKLKQKKIHKKTDLKKNSNTFPSSK